MLFLPRYAARWTCHARECSSSSTGREGIGREMRRVLATRLYNARRESKIDRMFRRGRIPCTFRGREGAVTFPTSTKPLHPYSLSGLAVRTLCSDVDPYV